jgi:HD-GYP domain-containing protein (c-di-GMP phosphodiesterase class II)
MAGGSNANERRAWAYTVGLALITGMVGAWLIVANGASLRPELVPLVLLVVIGLAAAAVPVRVPWATLVISADTLPIVVAAALLGPAAAFVVGVLGTIVIRQLAERKYRAFVFNRAMGGLLGGVSGLVYHALYPVTMAPGLAHVHISLSMVLAFTLSVMALTTVNHFAASFYIAAWRGTRVLAEAPAAMRHMLTMGTGALVLGPIMMGVYAAFGVRGLVFLILPMVGINLFLGRYQSYTKSFLAAVETMAKALGAKDELTLEHSQRVGEYASQIARQMHLSETQVGVMYYNGLLHDIGKLGVCDELLKKPSLFTPSEYEQVKVHAALGEQFTKPFWRVDRAIRRMNYVSYHHERWDGRGYPRGLAGEEIPLGGRILAVADAFDAMTSDRPYHKGIKKEQAFTELIRCAGAQFDPIVVKAFLESQGVSVPPSYERRVRAQELMAHRRTAMRPTVVPSSPTES